MLLTLPAAVGLAIAAEPIIRVLFERGAFGGHDTPATAWALAAFAVGLPSFVLIKVLQPAFFAREDTRTPMRFAVQNMIVNVVGSIGLFFLFARLGFMPHVGIALATSIAGWVNAWMLWRALAARGEFESDRRLRKNLTSSLIASAAMGALLVVLLPWASDYTATSQPGFLRVLALAILVLAGAALYAVLVLWSGVLDRAQLRRFFGRRRAPAE